MQTTGIFTIHKFDIPFKKYGEPVYLFPVGDIHWENDNCHKEKFREFCEWAKDKPNSYFLGMGDYMDISSASNREKLKGGLYDTTLQTLDKLYKKITEDFYKEIEFMKGKVIGLIEGNHYSELQSGITTTQYLCQLLECKYLGCSSFIRLSFKQNSSHNSNRAIDIWAHHGKGAAKKVGGSLNRVEDMANAATADIYLMGHDHKKSCGYLSQLELSEGGGNLTLRNRKKLIARTGSFLKAYVPEKVSYIADMAANPADLGVIKIELTPKREMKDGKDTSHIDIHTSI